MAEKRKGTLDQTKSLVKLVVGNFKGVSLPSGRVIGFSLI
jgi:hypothetical protein